VDGRTGADRWSQDYDRSPGDAIKIQTDIAENVASALSAALGAAARSAISVGGTQNATAQKLLLEATALANGMTFAGQTTEAVYRQALYLLDQAIAADPHYADAYAHKAVMIDSFANHFGHGSEDLLRARSEAMDYAQRSISLAPNLPYAHLALANLHRSNLELAGIGPELQKALALAPSDPEILRNYSVLKIITGKADQAISLADRVLGLDPLNGISYGLKMLALFSARRYDDAVRTAQQTPKELFVSWVRLGDCLQMLGRTAEALRAYENAPRDDPLQLAGEGILEARTGNRTAALEKVERLRQLFGDGGSYQFGEIYAQLGNPDESLANLEHAWEIKDPGMVGLKTDPFLDPIRSDPRYAALLKRLNFP
jgi:tetratricopeptide (TPR) repeat protein